KTPLKIYDYHIERWRIGRPLQKIWHLQAINPKHKQVNQNIRISVGRVSEHQSIRKKIIPGILVC
ncbi:hypothetical protein KKG20_03365, partial [bacterium]|nr:hypothetical protein [bacterium]